MDNKLMKQAQNIWSMLDDMAINDPENYKKFIAKNLNEKPDVMLHPKPNFTVESIIIHESKENEDTIFVNIMEWSIIPDCNNDTDPISICGGLLCEEKGALFKTASVAFNPNILHKYGKNCKSMEEKNMLIYLAFEFIESLNNIKLKKAYKLLKENFKGQLSVAVANIISSISKQKDNTNKNIALSDNSLLSNIKDSFKYSETDNEPQLKISSLTNSNLLENKCKSQKPLIEELSTKEDDNQVNDIDIKAINLSLCNLKKIETPLMPNELKDSDDNLEDINFNSKYSTPIYLLTKVGIDQLRIVIELPDVSNVNECQLDVGPNDLQMIVADKYYLSINFVDTVSPEDVEALFSKKLCNLTIMLPIVNSL